MNFLKKTTYIILLAILVALTSNLFGSKPIPVSPYSQQNQLSSDSTGQNILDRLKKISGSNLSLLPQNDCHLLDIENDCYLYYVAQKKGEIPAEINRLISTKRKEIDYKRSYIDSLLYIEALSAINVDNPDWKKALLAIDLSLTYNRFFLRSVLFKWSYLQRLSLANNNWSESLAFASNSLAHLSWNPKIQNIGNTLYNLVLEKIEGLVQDKLYQDALHLYDTLNNTLLKSFPLHYSPYREGNILHTAYQGMFNSYFAVAQRAFDQKMYKLSQYHSLLAYKYYKNNEKYMSGINPTLPMLENIIQAYRKFLKYSDKDEKSYYMAMIDSICSITQLSPKEKLLEEMPYDMDKELSTLSKEKDAISSEIVQDEDTTKVKKTFVLSSGERDSLYNKVVLFKDRNLSTAQAQKQWNAYVETARLFNAKRKFVEAHTAYLRADTLRRFYPIKLPAGFIEEQSSNDLLAVEQMLNKAQYRLWNKDVDGSDSLFSTALSIAESSELLNRIPIQNMVDNFKTQRQAVLCKFYTDKWNETLKEVKRQIFYNNLDKALVKMKFINDSYAASLANTSDVCLMDTVLMGELRKQLSSLIQHKCFLDSSLIFLENGDSNKYIQYQLLADSYHNSNKMSSFSSATSTLFSRLSLERNYTLLTYYALVCVENKQYEQAEFILSYLRELQHTSPLYENLIKILKKGKI